MDVGLFAFRNEAVYAFEACALDDAMVAGGVLHQPVADITAKDISASRSRDAERRPHALGEHGYGAIPVKTGLAPHRPWKWIVLRIEPVAGDAPAIAGRAGDQCIARHIPIEAYCADQGVSANSKLDRNRLILHCLPCSGVRGQVRVVELQNHKKRL